MKEIDFETLYTFYFKGRWPIKFIKKLHEEREKLLPLFQRTKLKFLPNKMRTILILRYGLDGHPCQTLASIGAKFNFTREGVRYLIRQAFKKIKEKYPV